MCIPVFQFSIELITRRDSLRTLPVSSACVMGLRRFILQSLLRQRLCRFSC
jgi:hypothetical protein